VAVVFAAGDVEAPTPILCCLAGRRSVMVELQVLHGLGNVIPSIRMGARHHKVLLKQLSHAIKVNCSVKIEAEALVKRGEEDESLKSVTDPRTVEQILESKDQDESNRSSGCHWNSMLRSRFVLRSQIRAQEEFRAQRRRVALDLC